ncbi:hypothetical protein Aab01nite_45540 [Paractinoplanes abujensis]|uniref:Uncharacterized protein n=1 Tax=Paractinoplanes abujensis TaxID=882441 RepID=A0A7W7CKW9_9ACTN|nr:hypothetical protein [Actinoplanes abujensis]MBB4690199.1 hypothetical protein [Actinoplanes abujensis]GID20964.1 hypothetical protein Aab01nite_45540 [Actinoplanes abujensis]
MRRLILIGSAVGVLIAGALTLLNSAADTVDVPMEIAKWLMNLAVAVVITGGLTVEINKRNLDRSKRDERTAALTQALQEVKAAYEEGLQLRKMLQQMLTSMRLLAEEYRDNYRVILRDAAREQAALDKVRAGTADDVELTELDPERFPRLYDFLDEQSFAAGAFQQSCSASKRQLQEWLLTPSTRTVTPGQVVTPGTSST